MIELRGCKELNIKELVKELKDKNKEKLQFSFVTKMLNIIDDKRYPIFDSYVAKAFALNYVVKESDEERIEQYIVNYKLITDVYNDLLLRCLDIIAVFKDKFRYAEDLSDMRILDIIVWKIGETITKEKHK